MRTWDIDGVAKHLYHLGRIGRDMPPSWDGGRVTIPVMSPDGHYLGKILPGKGLYLDSDLKYVGITKKIPGVFERSLVRRFYDKLKNDRWAINVAAAVLAGLVSPGAMMANISAYDDILTALNLGQLSDSEIEKASITTVALSWSSLVRTTGVPLGVTYTNVPTGAALTNKTTGGLGIGINSPVPVGTKCYLTQVGMQTGSQSINLTLIIDLLVGAGNISANTTSATTVSSAALTRYTSGVGVQMTFEVTTALGATASNITVSYTNQAGTTGQVTPAQAMTTSAITSRIQPISVLQPAMQLVAGDYGIQTVASVTFSAAMLAGVVALNLFYPLVMIPSIQPTSYVERDIPFSIDGLIELVQDSSRNTACLGAYILPTVTSSGIIGLHLKAVTK